jgi:hypothetical protein
MASARVFLMFALVAIVVMACQIEARTLRGIDIERTTATCAKWGKHKAAAGTNGDATVSNTWLPRSSVRRLALETQKYGFSTPQNIYHNSGG